MRHEGQLLYILVNKFFKIRRKEVDRAALGVFCVIIVPAAVGGADLDYVIGLVADDGAGEFAPGDEALDQHFVAVGPVLARQLLRRMCVIGPHDDDAEGGALGDRLHHIGRRQHVPARRLAPVDRDAPRERNAGGAQNVLGAILVHG